MLDKVGNAAFHFKLDEITSFSLPFNRFSSIKLIGKPNILDNTGVSGVQH